MPMGRRPVLTSGTTRAPGAIPARLPTGIRYSLPLEKPITSASTSVG